MEQLEWASHRHEMVDLDDFSVETEKTQKKNMEKTKKIVKNLQVFPIPEN